MAVGEEKVGTRGEYTGVLVGGTELVPTGKTVCINDGVKVLPADGVMMFTLGANDLSTKDGLLVIVTLVGMDMTWTVGDDVKEGCLEGDTVALS